MKVLSWVALAILVDEVLSVVVFTSYIPYFFPSSVGLSVQNALWALSYPVVWLTNALTPVFAPYLSGQGLADHLAYFIALAVFSVAALSLRRGDKIAEGLSPISVFAFGMLMTIAGAFADAYWHLTGLAAKEGFFTPAHATIYSGATIMLASTLFLDVSSRVKNVLRVGGVVVIAGGVWDFWYHSVHGFVDVVAWTPPHLTVTAGFVILLATGITKLKGGGRFPDLAFRVTAGLFVVLWSFVVALTLA
ncbi:MAG TPA: hypothetical protein VLU99_02055 [Nitrososphaerales archaeon]|nr:hypothetical protein [Nitrososphaerales archaeon]HUK74547.1 hypothetical protein [Nitrososphaerales archaeon]